MSGPRRILVIDDEPNVRLMFRTALESAGYEVDDAGDGEEGLLRLAAGPVDLILLDLRMPRLDGMAMLRALRDAGSDIPVAIVTAHGSIPDAVAAMKLGAVDFLTKPVTPEALRTAVAAVLDRHAEPEPDAAQAPASPRPIVTVGPAVVELARAKRALNLRRFDEAERLLREAIDLAPDSAEAHTLMGLLHESLGEDHAAYRSYRAALEADRSFGPARENLRRYCERFGLDFTSKAINPGAV
jgi:DNA-binding response OmpR family regulator